LLWPFDNFTHFPQSSERLVHYLYHFCCCRRSCPIDLFIGANFRSFGVRAREKIESFGEREENYYTTPARPALYLPLSAMNGSRLCVMKMKGFAASLTLCSRISGEIPILRRISFLSSCPTRQTWCSILLKQME
jgi:hypothetical protein